MRSFGDISFSKVSPGRPAGRSSRVRPIFKYAEFRSALHAPLTIILRKYREFGCMATDDIIWSNVNWFNSSMVRQPAPDSGFL